MTILTNPDQIAAFRLLTLRSMLKLEIHGMTRSGRSAYATIKSELGLRGNKIRVYDQLSAMLQRSAFNQEAK